MIWNLSKRKYIFFLSLFLILPNTYAHDSFSAHCRQADFIPNSFYEFEWNPSDYNNVLAFDTLKDLVRVESTGTDRPGHVMSYKFVPPRGNGSRGSLAFDDVDLEFRALPFGTIRGEPGKYLIGVLLSTSKIKEGIYLCPPRLTEELHPKP